MSDTEDRADRMARYKEERRKQLAAQFGVLSQPQGPVTKRTIHKDISCSISEEPRTTRASRLRAAAIGVQESSSTTSSSTKLNDKEKSSSMKDSNNKLERDKSGKRKSNLNRALNSEEVPQCDTMKQSDDPSQRRRGRRFFPPEVLQHNHVSSTIPTVQLKKSELSIHMENARKGICVPYSEMGKVRSTAKRTEIVNGNKENNPSSVRRSSNVSKRMDELSILTREALERVESLTKRTNHNIDTSGRSILKKKSIEEIAPVSILKRRISKEESVTPPTHTPPVTFSPSVVDPSTSRKRQGILKKRRSLDEAQVLRHRSCSPFETKSILKNRRSSLEELTLHGILKRKSSHEDDSEPPFNSPEPTHGILKRKSGLTTVQHVSIATAVILAAAGGAEMILDEPLTKPILKKKSSLPEELLLVDTIATRPILKKTYSVDIEDFEDKPIKTILKNTDPDSRQSILKIASSRENSPRPRLSFCTDEETNNKKSSRRSYTVCTDTNVGEYEDRNLHKPRPLSVSDIVLNIEKRLSTGAIPKRTSSNRHSERYRTQPVTFHELEASLNSVQSTSFQVQQQLTTTEVCSQNALSMVDLTTSFNSDNNILNLDNFLSSSLPNSTMDSSGKMSSDSAFQSLGDGLELEHEERILPVRPQPGKLQMKALAEEAAKNVRLKSGYRGRADKPNSSRFSTQPITLGEVRQASICGDGNNDSDNEPEPSRLSISERINLFNAKPLDEKKPRFTRFQTQPITLEEIESARVPVAGRKGFALDTTSHKEKKGILKCQSGASHKSSISPMVDQLKSALKKKGSSTSSLKSILKPDSSEFLRDEGISSDETASDSEVVIISDSAQPEQIISVSRSDPTQTSDGESSGGREVRSIIMGGTTKWKTHESISNEGSILKSKSQGVVRDEEEKQTTPRVRRSLTQAAMPKMIAELQAKLQNSGDREWRKRTPRLNSANEELKNIYNEELSEKTSILAARKDELDAASKQWKSRVEQSDAINFSVAGRMQQSCNTVDNISINIPTPAKSKRTPRAKAFKSKEGGDIGSTVLSTSTPTSPEKNSSNGIRRSTSLPGAGDEEPSEDGGFKISTRKVQIERPDDSTFKSFFKSTSSHDVIQNSEISINDFDSISRENLLVQKRTVKVQRRREASKNPVKALAAREDIKDEYTEIITGIAEREKLRLNVEKLSKTSNFAIEALAGLASKEDFSSVALKRSSSVNTTYPPFSELMLLQIKGRRYIQTRLVEPITSSINDGDCFILVTPDVVYNYIGTYANIIEQTRASDIVSSIQQTSDLGSRCEKVVVINAKKPSSCNSTDLDKFWSLLGASKDIKVCGAGHPDEDEIYESSIFGTNMLYEYNNEMLIPFELYWGAMPKIHMLSPLKIFVFDYGSEMYVWSGKNAVLDDKKKALKLARELWNEGFNYTECGVSPLDVSTKLGLRSSSSTPVLKDKVRPKWSLFAKITQHRETILFKEKFLDWPDYSRVIRVKKDDVDKNWDKSKYDFKPCDIEKMHKANKNEPNLEIDGMHLGRGISYFDEDTNRLFNFSTRSVKCWIILEFSQEMLEEKSIGQFYNGHSYIIRWEYCANITGRELSGKPSKFIQAGRDNCVYFCWQGIDATINEKGAAALITVQLDSENARQIRVLQGYEPPAFLNLFNGGMVVHSGKCDAESDRYRLYISRGEIETESFLTEVPCSMRSFRSRASFLLVNEKSITIWNGVKASPLARKIAKRTANIIADKMTLEGGFSVDTKASVVSIEEGSETEEFLTIFGGDKRQLYRSLIKHKQIFNYTPRLYHLSSITGELNAAEVLCSYRSEISTAYPFLQSDMYMANQPALFMLDNQYEIWLWQGWWPDREDDDILSDQTGSGAIRWQEERKSAMQTVVNYTKRFSPDKHVPAYLVWAGLEPLAFTNLFPYWRDRDDVAVLNIQDGRKAGDTVILEKELDLLTRSTYPLDQLLQRPLPDGVDPTQLENYLSPHDFTELMSMSLEEFQKLPIWKQTAVKKEKGLF